MQKTLAIISLLIITVFISCTGAPSDSEPAEPIAVDVSTAIAGSSGSTQVSEPIATEGGAQEISLKGLEAGKLYTVYTSSDNTRASRRAAEPSPLSYLDNGAYSLCLPEGQTEITFTASDIGLADGGDFRVGNVATNTIDFQDGSKGMTIGQQKTTPVFVEDNGTEYFEAFYRIDVSTIPNPDRFVINEVISHTGRGGGSRSGSGTGGRRSRRGKGRGYRSRCRGRSSCGKRTYGDSRRVKRRRHYDPSENVRCVQADER